MPHFWLKYNSILFHLCLHPHAIQLPDADRMCPSNLMFWKGNSQNHTLIVVERLGLWEGTGQSSLEWQVIKEVTLFLRGVFSSIQTQSHYALSFIYPEIEQLSATSSSIFHPSELFPL